MLRDGSLHGWIGGGCAKSVVIRAAQEAIDTAVPKLVRISNEEQVADASTEVHAMACASDGSIELFIQPNVAHLVLILGTTPAAHEALELAGRMGFRITEDPGARPHFVIVATQGEGDLAALETALESGAERVLLIASPRKTRSLIDALRHRGVAQEALSRLQAPAGPDIGAQTPAEIALAAVAGLVSLRRNVSAGTRAATGETSTQPQTPESDSAVSASYRNPVCGVAVDPAKARHTVEHGGEMFYFCCDGCLVEFEKDPGRYAAIQARQTGASVA